MRYLRFGIFAIIICIGLSFKSDRSEEKNKILLYFIKASLENHHYSPKIINDEFAAKIFDLYLDRLDNGKRYLLQHEYDSLYAKRLQIDDQIQAGTFQFFNESANILSNRLDSIDDIFAEILSKPFDFKKQEQIEFDEDKEHYATNMVELKDKWRKWLKYQTLTRLSGLLEKQKDKIAQNDSGFIELPFDSLEAQARSKVLKNHDDWYRRVQQQTIEDRRNTFFNVIANVFDPHTEFFPPKDKEDFDIRMSGKLEGIGATLQESDGYVKVVRIVPGSASWRQGELKAGDLILEVGQGDDEPVDIVDMRLDEAVQLIRGKKGTQVVLTVKKRDGATTKIPITRDVVILEETFAKSAIVTKNGSAKKVGYIYLPRFYVDFNDRKGRACAEDVAKEIKKLKEEGITGLVLDLRNNGGGSLGEAINLGGLFIEKGPIVQVKDRYGSLEVKKDFDRDVQYDGHLVVLINSVSASASEILAAAMQDYERAVIIGSSSSYGKGTVQQFLDLDRFLNNKSEYLAPMGSIKITIQKFYRINGGATQLKGVMSDITLPDKYMLFDIGEKELENYIPWDEIEPADYDKWLDLPKMDKLKKLSSKRIKKSKRFKDMVDYAKFLKEKQDASQFSLNFTAYQAEQEAYLAESKKYTEEEEIKTSLILSPLKEQFEQMESDTVKNTQITEWHDELSKDIYLEEAFSVLEDMAK